MYLCVVVVFLLSLMLRFGCLFGCRKFWLNVNEVWKILSVWVLCGMYFWMLKLWIVRLRCSVVVMLMGEMLVGLWMFDLIL